LNSKGEISNKTEAYDPETDTWTLKAPIPVAVYSYSSVVVDNRIHVLSYTTHMIYDPQADTWSYGVAPPIAVPVGGAAGVTSGVMAPKRIHVIGAVQGQNTFNQVYDPRSDSWGLGASMPSARFYCAVAVVNDKVYVIGGVRDVLEIPQHYFSTNEEYTPFAYGNPYSTDPLPTFSPSPSPTPSPIVTPSPTQPTSSPNLTPAPTTTQPPTHTPTNPKTPQSPDGSPLPPASDSPALSPQPQAPLSTELIYIAAAGIATILAAAVIISFLKKRK
jgi:hypothetical protein